MLVKQRLRINSIVSAASVLAILVVLVVTIYGVNRALEEATIADSIITASFERLMLRTDHLRTGHERSKIQLIAKHNQIGELLKAASEKFPAPEDKRTISELLAIHESIGKFFRALRENRGKTGPTLRPGALSREFEDRMLSQLNMWVYETVVLSGKLQESGNEAVISSLKMSAGAILLVLLLVCAATVINSRIMSRSITERVLRLREGAAVIGGGNLYHRIDVIGDDELAGLSRELNAMTEKLQKSYLDLEHEIAERKRAEDAMKQVQEDLEIRVLERTEDLVRVNEELEIEVSRRKMAGEELKCANAYNRSLIEASLDPLVTINIYGKITDINFATEKVTGLSREEIIGSDFSGYFTDPDKAQAGYRQVFSEGSVTDYPLEILHRDGHITPVLYNAAVYRDEAGEVIGVFAAARDISGRIDAEDKLFRLNRLYSVLSKINEAIVRLNDPHELYERVCRIIVEYGLFRMAWIGLKDLDTLIVKPVVSYGDRNGYLDGITIFANDLSEGKGPTGRAIYEDRYFICSDFDSDPNMLPWLDKARLHGFRSSAAFPLRVSGKVIGALTIYSHVPQFFTDAEIYLLSSLADDISFAIDAMNNEQKRLEAEEALRNLNEDLERRITERTSDLELANKELESFSYSVSHDLRSPLRHMSGFVELLRKRFEGQLDETGIHYLQVISGASKKMGRLIDDLLIFSRIGRSEMQMKQVNLTALTRAAIDEVMKVERVRSIEWKIDRLPRVQGDASMLSLVLVNLISNAVKFTRTRPLTEIEIGCSEDADEFICHIKDNGVGFNMKYAGKLFGVFQRLHAQEEFEGTGIGLANVQRIISRHGGRTWAEGEEGLGAVFYFTLPKMKGA